MGTWNAFYVLTKNDSDTSVIRAKFPSGEIVPGPEFIGVQLGVEAFPPPTDGLVRLSAELNTDVIWLSFQSTVDAFEFHHWRAGVTLRSLVFGCYKDERTWELVEGEPEPWEREAFFDAKGLRFPLEYAKTDEKRRELERIWREAELLPGRTEPSLDSCDSAWKVAEYYRFPGFR